MTRSKWLRCGVLSTALVLLVTTAIAQQSSTSTASKPTLTEDEAAALKARVKERHRQLHPDVEHVRGATGGVSVGVRCTEGYVSAQRIVPSVPDVEIVATARTECDGYRCRGLQVTARRSHGSFDLDVEASCSSS